MNLSEYCNYDALGLADLVARKEVRPSEVCALALKAAEKVNPQINAIIQSYPERAEKADHTVDINTPFAGVPFFLKDLAGEEGCLVESGSRMFEGYRAKSDSLQVKLFRESGVVILGRSAVPEFGGGGCTESTLHGVTNNPWDLARTAGGSSGGAASLVAAGVTPISQSGDGGGSTRYPAACCGLVGLKTSRGMISVGPDTNDIASPLISKFVVSRTVRDSAAMFDALHTPTSGEATPFFRLDEPLLETIKKPGASLKIALSLDGWAPDVPEPGIKKKIRETAQTLEGLGHVVEEIDQPPVDVHNMHELYIKGALAIFRGIIKAASQATGRPIGPDTLEPITLKYNEEGANYGLPDFAAFIGSTNTFARQLGEFFENYDLMLTPVTGVHVPPHGDHALTRKDVGGAEHIWESYYKAPFLGLQNLAGVPAISVPAGLDENGLPVGAQLTAPIGRDGRLLRIAAKLEEAMPWRDLAPPVFAGH